MAKIKKRRASGPPSSIARAQLPPGFPAHVSLGYDPAGRMEPRDIVSSKEGWSEYTLSDGSVIRAKVVLLEIKRAVGQFNIDGDPIYVMQLTAVNQVVAPEHLRKGYIPKIEDKGN